MKKSFIRALFFPIVLGFLILLLLSFFGDLKKTLSLLINFPLGLFLFILLFNSLGYFIRFLRWEFFLAQILKKRLPTKISFSIFLSGFAMVITPLRSGELLKAYLVKKVTGVGESHTAPIVIMERFTDALSMLILMTAGLLLYRYGIFLFILVVLTCLVFIFLIQNRAFAMKILEAASFIPIFKNHFLTKAKNMYESAYVLTKAQSLILGTAIGILAWSTQIISNTLLIKNLYSQISLSPATLILTVAFIFSFSAALGFSIPAPGGLGVNETSTAGLLILLLGLPKETAAAATILIRLSTIWLAVSLGLISLFLLTKKLSQSSRSSTH